jgi:hypothetical protein
MLVHVLRRQLREYLDVVDHRCSKGAVLVASSERRPWVKMIETTSFGTLRKLLVLDLLSESH